MTSADMLSVSDDPALQLLAAQKFVHDRVPAPPAQPLHASGPARQGRIRIGYLSGDLCLHAVGMTGSAEVRIGERSVLNFLLRPMIKSKEAFRER